MTKIATTSNSCLLRQNAWAVVLQLRSLAHPPRPLVQHYTVVHTGAPLLYIVHTLLLQPRAASYIACSQLSNSLGREAPSLLLHHLKKNLFFCVRDLLHENLICFGQQLWILELTVPKQTLWIKESLVRVWKRSGKGALPSFSSLKLIRLRRHHSTTRVRTPRALV
jgi:hypothetical protein